MLARLKRASRRSIAFVWAMSAMFAMAPALSMALASPVGAFSRSFIHVHADDEPGHVHHGHHHHHHDHDHDGDQAIITTAGRMMAQTTTRASNVCMCTTTPVAQAL